jgi:hypothetical protein
MLNEGLYGDKYAEFLTRRANATGYDFGQAPVGNVPPPSVTFAQPLRWWSLDRPRRLAAILALRDRLQDEILALARGTPGITGTIALRTPHRAARERDAVFLPGKERPRRRCPEDLRWAA